MPDRSWHRTKILSGCALAATFVLLLAACDRMDRPGPTLVACQRIPANDLDRLKSCLEVEKTRLENDKLNLEIKYAVRDLSNTGLMNLFLQNFTTFAAILAGLFAVLRYVDEKRKARAESESTRFEGVVGALGSEVPQARIGAAALLATFLDRGYTRFYLPVFKLSVGYLMPYSTEGGQLYRSSRRRYAGEEFPPVGALNQMLASVIKTAYPLALVSLS